jgi:hypothetical protein
LITGWLLVNLIGFGFAGALFHNFPLNFSSAPNTFRTPFSLPPAVVGFFFGAIPALLIGWSQRMTLRRTWPLSRWWILSVSLGMGAMHFLADGYEFARDGTTFVLAGGVALGLIQFLLLRRHTSTAREWGLAASGSWLLGWLIGVLIVDALGLPDDGRGNALQHGLLGGMAGLLYGLSTLFLISRSSGHRAG